MARWHPISHAVMAERKDGGSYMTRTVDQPQWTFAVLLINKSAGFPSLMTQTAVMNALGMALTQCGWVPVVARPARGTQDAVALRWGRSREIYWWRGSAFWPETSVKRAGQTENLSPCERWSHFQHVGTVATVLGCFRDFLHNWVNCLFTVSKEWISSSFMHIQFVLVSATSQAGLVTKTKM